MDGIGELDRRHAEEPDHESDRGEESGEEPPEKEWGGRPVRNAPVPSTSPIR